MSGRDDAGEFGLVEFWDSLQQEWRHTRRAAVLRAEAGMWSAQAAVDTARLAAEEAAERVLTARLARGWQVEEAALKHALAMQEMLFQGAERLRAFLADPGAYPPGSERPQRALPSGSPPMLPEVTDDDLEAAAIQYAFRLHGLSPSEQQETLTRLPGELRTRFDRYTAAELERRIRRLRELAG